MAEESSGISMGTLMKVLLCEMNPEASPIKPPLHCINVSKGPVSVLPCKCTHIILASAACVPEKRGSFPSWPGRVLVNPQLQALSMTLKGRFMQFGYGLLRGKGKVKEEKS